MATKLDLTPAPSEAIDIGSRQPDGSGEERISRILLNLWVRIPEDQRKAIVDHWRKRCCVPQVVLLNPWRGKAGADACCLPDGDTIWMNWARIKILPDSRIEPILAHEMAHVLQWATGKDRERITPADISGDELLLAPDQLGPIGRVEVHADQVIGTWGYNALDNLMWIKQHTQEKDDKLILRKRPILERNARSKAKSSQMYSYICDLPPDGNCADRHRQS